MTDIAEQLPVKIRSEIASLAAYAQGKQASEDAFKLSSNENPFSPLPSVVAAIQAATNVNRYPDASARRLRERLAERYGVTPDHVHVGAGSVSILSQLILAAATVGDEVMYAWRSFEAYPGLVRVAGATSVQVPLKGEHQHDLDAMVDAINDRTRVIIICSPNNPTGGIITEAEFEAFLSRVPSDVLVVLDEAYAEFVTHPEAVNGLQRGFAAAHPNVVVLRTFSKAYGLAGLRVGYAIGHPAILSAAQSTAIPLSVTGPAEVAALASLDAEDELLAQVTALNDRRARMIAGLRAAGIAVPDSQANFVWISAGEASVAVAEAFSEGGAVVRPFAGDGVRISIGEDESVDVVIRIARSIVEMLPQEALNAG